MDYKIRSATPEDRNLIYALHSQSVRPYVEKNWGWDEGYQQKDFDRDFSHIEQFKVIEMDGRLVGFVQCYLEHSRYHVVEMHLRPEYRGKGIGSDILKALQESCMVQGGRIQIGCFKENDRAKNLYQKLGLVQIEETDTHYILEWDAGMRCGIQNGYHPELLGDIRVNIEQIDADKEREMITRMILESLPDWFGIPEAREEYVSESKSKPFFCALDGETAVGFLYLKETGRHTVELAVMGVRKEYHRRGIGRKLFDAAKKEAKKQGYSFIQVKTVQMGKYAEYDDTNQFYLSLGFKELEVFPHLWDEWNPCQIYIMAI